MLGVERRVILEETTHADEISRTPRVGEEGWVVTPRGRKELRRIPFLAKARNRVLEPLVELQAEGGRNGSFDRLLFLNDVIFTVRPPPHPPPLNSLDIAGCKLICERDDRSKTH